MLHLGPKSRVLFNSIWLLVLFAELSMASLKRRSSINIVLEETFSVSKRLNSNDSGPPAPLESPHLVSLIKLGRSTLALKTLMMDPLYIVENRSSNSEKETPAKRLLLAPMNQYVSSGIPAVILSVDDNLLTVDMPNLHPSNHFIVYTRKDNFLTVLFLPCTVEEVIEDATAIYYIVGKDATAFLTMDSIVDAIRRNAQDKAALRNIDAIIQIIL